MKKLIFKRQIRRLYYSLNSIGDDWYNGFPLIARTLHIPIRKFNNQYELSKAFIEITASKFQPKFVRERLGLIPNFCFFNITEIEDSAKPMRVYSESMRRYSFSMWRPTFNSGSGDNEHWMERSFCVYYLFMLLSSPPVPDDKRIMELYESLREYLLRSLDDRFTLDIQFLSLLFSVLAFIKIGEGYFIDDLNSFC